MQCEILDDFYQFFAFMGNKHAQIISYSLARVLFHAFTPTLPQPTASAVFWCPPLPPLPPQPSAEHHPPPRQPHPPRRLPPGQIPPPPSPLPHQQQNNHLLSQQHRHQHQRQLPHHIFTIHNTLLARLTRPIRNAWCVGATST